MVWWQHGLSSDENDNSIETSVFLKRHLKLQGDFKVTTHF